MRLILLPLTSLFISCFIMMLGNGLINILLPVRMDLEAMPTQTIGAVLSLYYVGMLIGALYARNLIQRAGHIRMFAGALALAAASVLVCSLLADAWLWGAMRIVIGFCNACAFTAMESWLSESADKDNRGKVLAFYQVIVLGALFSGQFLINLANPQETVLFILGGILLCTSIVPIVLSRVSGPRVEDVTSISLLALFKLSPLGVVSCVIAGILYSATFNMLPVFAKSHGVSGFDLSLYMGAAIMGAFLLQFPVGYLSDRFDRRTILLIALITSSLVGLSINVFAGNNWFWITSLATAISCGIIACVYPLSVSETFDRLRQSEMVAAMGCLVMIFSFGGMLGPFVASYIMNLFGDAALFWFLAITQASLGTFVIYRMFARSALPSDQQEQFVMQGAALASIADIDPRTEYQEPEQPLSSEAVLATEIADSDPTAAVNMVRAAVLSESEQGVEIAGAIAAVDGIDVLRLYHVLQEAAPEQILPITSALVTSKPELAYEMISQLAVSMPDKVVEVATKIGRTIPELRLEMARIAVEAAPESAIEVAEYYSQVLAEEYDSVRPADRDEDNTEQVAVDLVSQISDLAPDHAIDVAATVIEAMPDTAASVAAEFATNLSESRSAEFAEDFDDSSISSNTAEEEAEEINQEMTQLVTRLSEAAPEQSLDIASAVAESVPDAAASIANKYANQLSETYEASSDNSSLSTSTADEDNTEFNQEVAELVTRLSEAAPDQSLDIASAVVEAIPDSAVSVTTEYANSLSESRSAEPSPALTTHEDESDELNQEIVDLYSRMFEAAPGQSLDIAEAVVEAFPESAASVASEYANNLLESRDDESLEEITTFGANFDTSAVEAEAAEELTQEVVEFASRLSEVAPEQSMDIAGALVDAIPQCASEIIDEISKGDESADNELVVNLEDHPKRS